MSTRRPRHEAQLDGVATMALGMFIVIVAVVTWIWSKFSGGKA